MDFTKRIYQVSRPVDEYSCVQTVLGVLESAEAHAPGSAEAMRAVYRALGALDVVE